MAAARNGPTRRDGKIVIKKYANRRLYNTAKSSYVTLDDLSRMVRAGEDFVVFDAKSGDDITHSVLTQIIFEEEQKGQNMLPTNFLRQLIRLYGDALQGVVPSYLEASMEQFARNQEQMREAFRANPALANWEAMTRQNIELFQQSMRMLTPFALPGATTSERAGTEPPAQEPAADEPPAAGAGEVSPEEKARRERDLDALKRQLIEMQSQLEQISKPKE